MATTSQLKEMFGAGQVITASNFEELIDYIDSVSAEAGGGVDSASFTSLSDSVNSLSSSVSTLNNSVGEFGSLSGSVSTMYEEIYGVGGGGLVSGLSDLSTNVGSLSDSISSLSSSVSTHEDSISAATDSLSSLSDSVSTLNDSLADFVSTMTGGCGGTMGGVIGSINESVSTLNDSVSTIEESLSTALADMPQVTDGEGNGAYDFEVYYSINSMLEVPSWWTSESTLEEASFTVSLSNSVYNVPIFHATPAALHVDISQSNPIDGIYSGLIYFEGFDYLIENSAITFCSVEDLESFDFIGFDGINSIFPGPQIRLLGGHEKIEIKVSEADTYFSGLQSGADGEYIDTTSTVDIVGAESQINSLNVFEHMTANTKFVYFYNDDYNYYREIKIRYPHFSVSNSVEQMTMQTTTLGVGEVVGFRLIHGNFDSINVEVPYKWALQPINSVTV